MIPNYIVRNPLRPERYFNDYYQISSQVLEIIPVFRMVRPFDNKRLHSDGRLFKEYIGNQHFCCPGYLIRTQYNRNTLRFVFG